MCAFKIPWYYVSAQETLFLNHHMLRKKNSARHFCQWKNTSIQIFETFANFLHSSLHNVPVSLLEKYQIRHLKFYCIFKNKLNKKEGASCMQGHENSKSSAAADISSQQHSCHHSLYTTGFSPPSCNSTINFLFSTKFKNGKWSASLSKKMSVDSIIKNF